MSPNEKNISEELVTESSNDNTTTTTITTTTTTTTPTDHGNVTVIVDDNKLNGETRDINSDPEASKEGGQVTTYLTGLRLSLVMIGLGFAVFLAALDQTIVSTALPAIASEFQSLDQISWVATSYLLTTTSLQTTYGKLSDIFGRKATFLFAIVTFELGSLLCGLAPNMLSMIIFRAIGGIGAGGIISLVIIIIADIVPLQDRGKYQGIIGACFGVSSIVGPLLGGTFTDKLTWRWAFFINLPFGAITLATVIAFLRLPKPTGSLVAKLKRVDYYGTGMLIIATITVLLPLSWGGNQYAWNSAVVITLLCLGILFYVAFGLIEWKVAIEPVAPPHLFKNLNILGSFGVNLFQGMAFFGFIYYVPLYFQIVRGDSATASGLELIPFILGVVIASIVIGQLISRTSLFSYRIICIFGSALIIIGSGLITTWTETTDHGQQIGYMLIFGIGVGSIMQTTILFCQHIVTNKDLAPVTALLLFFRTIGAVFGIAILGTIFQNKLSSEIDAIHLPPEIPVNLVKQSAQFVTKLPSPIRELVIGAYVRALNAAFIAIVPLGGATFISALFMGGKKPMAGEKRDTMANFE